ncbi:MAG TPA: hypothetical protein VGE20_07245 [Ramlibacter sp.]
MPRNSTRAFFWLGSAAWAAVAGLAGAAGAAAAVFIAAWAFVYGDHPWPPAMPWVIGGAAVMGAAGGVLLSAKDARSRRQRAQALPPAQGRAGLLHWAAAGTLVLAVLLATGVAWVRGEHEAARQARLHDQRRQALAASVHQPAAVALALGSRTIAVAAVLDGARAGRYRWQVRLAPAVTGVVLAKAESVLSLQPGAATHVTAFDTATVLAAWQGRLLGGRAGFVDQTLVADVTVEPELTAAEQQLQAVGLPLRRTARASTRLRMVADADGVRLLR